MNSFQGGRTLYATSIQYSCGKARLLGAEDNNGEIVLEETQSKFCGWNETWEPDDEVR